MFACKYTYAPTCCKHEHCRVDGVQVSVPVEARDSLGVFYSSSLSLNLKLLHSVKTTDEHPQDLPISAPPPQVLGLYASTDMPGHLSVCWRRNKDLYSCVASTLPSPQPLYGTFLGTRIISIEQL